MELKNTSVFITGGGSGIGAATARAFAKAGANVCVADLNKENAIAVADDINGLGTHCDVTDTQSLEDALLGAKEAHGTPRIIVHCAGILLAERVVGREGPGSLAHFQKVTSVNLNGTFNVLRMASNLLAKEEPVTEDGGRGVIINTSSIAGWEGQIGQVAYAASKAGVMGITLPAARELAKFGIRVMAIAPGMVATPMVLNLPEEIKASLEAQVPHPSRFAKPEEFAKLAMHIAENDILNGTTIRMDGAVRMQPK